MKKYSSIALLPFLGFFSFLSCKKANSTTPTTNNLADTAYYMKFTENGTQVSYTSGWAKPEMGDAPPYHTGYFTGGIPQDTFTNSFSIRIYSADSLEVNMLYTESIFSPLGIPSAYCDWVDPNGNHWLSFKTTADTIQPFSVTITGMTSAYVKGTFSGKAKQVNGTTIVTISDGEFYLQRQ